ncbi:MAG: heavy metal-binding domain-containing protein [Hyphomicrobiaceae bacterium]
MRFLTIETIDDGSVRHGEMIYACAVSGANILRDFRETIANTLGGNMVRYEKLLDATIARALDALAERARERGYDGVMAIRVSHPAITDGAAQVVVCGTGFHLVRSPAK